MGKENKKLGVMKYGAIPKSLGNLKVICNEMLFYQYLPIKMINNKSIYFEKRLECFRELIEKVIIDYVDNFGEESYLNSYIYLTAKHMYQTPDTSFNRMGYHTDGFMTDDINYIWCDKFPTIFNSGNFDLTMDDTISIGEMESQAKLGNEYYYSDNALLRLNQFNVHKVGYNKVGGMRTFVKISFSKDKYDLIGNSHNYSIDYDWEMKTRKIERNIPQTKI